VVATGYPRFSVLDMLNWGDAGSLEGQFHDKTIKFDDLSGSVALFGDDIEALADQLQGAFDEYYQALSNSKTE